MSLAAATQDVRGRIEALGSRIPQQIEQSGMIDVLIDAVLAGDSEAVQDIIVGLYGQNQEELADELLEVIEAGQNRAVENIQEL